MSTYTWTFNATVNRTGLEVSITIDPASGDPASGTATIKALKGSLDVNALWFSDGDTEIEGDTTLDNPSLNMNGSASQGITWDSVAELSPPGLGRDLDTKRTYLVEGEEKKFTLEELALDDLVLNTSELPIDYSTLIIGLRATSVNGNGSVKLVDKTPDVISTNEPPVASDDTKTTDENTVLESSVPEATDADGTVVSYNLVADVGEGNGTLIFDESGSYTFDPGSDFDALAPGDSRDVTFTYVATDNDGAVSETKTVTITVNGTNEQRLIVGSASDDKEGTTTRFTVVDTADNPPPQNFGPIIGGDANDILIGDVGGTEKNVKPGKNYNIALVVDGSGSMVSRLDLLKESLINLATDLADHDGIINLTLISFANSESERISIRGFGTDTLDELTAAINALTANGATNYESAFNLATGWFLNPDKADPDPEYNNQTYFVTDGNPTLYINADGINAGPGNSTDYATMLNSVESFQPLSSVSTVFGIGIGAGVNENLLRFFDTTDIAGSATQTFSLGYNLLAGFTNGGSASGINSASSWTVTGSGSKVVVNNTGTGNDYLELRDDRDSDTQAASVFTSPAFSISERGNVRFLYRAANSNLGDTILWELVNGEPLLFL